jgi:hypothetical protein
MQTTDGDRTMLNTDTDNELIGTRAVAKDLDVCTRTIAPWRAERINLPFIKFDGVVKYRKGDIRRFKEQHTVEVVG